MKVKISIHSWHYRLLSFYGFSIPYQLCNYFWKVFGTILATPFILILIGIFGIADLIPRRNKVEKPFDRKSNARKIIALKLFLIVWCIGFGIWDLSRADYLGARIMFGILGFSTLNWMGLKYKYERKPKKEKDPNIAWEMLKATKNRYCPLIEFTGINDIDERELNRWR